METYVGDLFPALLPRHWASDQRRRSRPARPQANGQGRHANSLAAHEAERERLNANALHLLAWMVGHEGFCMTDRQVRDGYASNADMNFVRPRITELCDAGYLWEVDKVPDHVTGINVRRTAPTAKGYARIRSGES